MKKTEVSIIILSWNTKKLLRNCLESLGPELQSQSPKLEVIVVDNGSSDGSPAMVEKEFPKVKLIKNKKNLGFAKANNQGIKKAKGETVMFLNSDTIVQRKAIETLSNYLKSEAEVGAVCPLILNQDKSVQIDPVYLRYPSLLTTLFYYNPLMRRVFLKFSLLRKTLFCPVDRRRPHPIDQLSGAALMVKKNVLEQVGLFDEKIPFYFEDADLSRRIQGAGWKTMVVPKAKIIHLRGASMAKAVAQKRDQFLYYQRNFASFFLFCQKHYPQWKTAGIRIGLFFSWLLSSLFYLPLAIFNQDFWSKIWTNLRLINRFVFSRNKERGMW